MPIVSLMRHSRNAARRARAALAAGDQDANWGGLAAVDGPLREIKVYADAVRRLRELDAKLDDRRHHLRSLRGDPDHLAGITRQTFGQLENEIARLSSARRDLEDEVRATLLPALPGMRPERPAAQPAPPLRQMNPVPPGEEERADSLRAGGPEPALPTGPDDEARKNDQPSRVDKIKTQAAQAFLPGAYLDDVAIANFHKNTGYRLTRGDDMFTLTDPSGHEMFALSEEQAAALAHIWRPDIARRVEAIRTLWRADLSPVEKRRRIEDEVYRNIREELRDMSVAGPGWIAMEGGGPEDFGQRLAADRLKAFDALAAAIESGATEREIADLVGEFHEAMLPEVFGLGRIVKEFLMDVAPGLGNIRSVRHLQNDIAEIEHAVETGEWGDAAMASGMAILDAIGIFPGLNTVKGVARGVARMIPYGDRLLGERSFRRLIRQWNETGDKFASIKVKDLVGDLLDGLDPKIGKSFAGLVGNRVGIVGETRTYNDVIKRMDPQASEQVGMELRKGLPTKTRVFDALASLPSEEIEIANAMLGRFARRLVAAGDEVIGGTKGAKKMIETKTGGGYESYAQEMARKALEKHPEETLRKAGADGFANLRNAPSEIPIEFLVEDISEYLDNWVATGKITKAVSYKLKRAMRWLKVRGVATVLFKDYVGFLARLEAALLRDGGEAMRVPVGMS